MSVLSHVLLRADGSTLRSYGRIKGHQIPGNDKKEEKTKTLVTARIPTQDITVQAIPNPFNDKVNFVITSPQAGHGSLEVMNMPGQKIKTVYSGQFVSDTQSFEMSLLSGHFNTLFYILRMNGKQVTGKLVQAAHQAS